MSFRIRQPTKDFDNSFKDDQSQRQPISFTPKSFNLISIRKGMSINLKLKKKKKLSQVAGELMRDMVIRAQSGF